MLARRFLNMFWAVVAGVMLGLLSTDLSVQGNAANTEVFMQLPIILSLLALFGAVGGDGRRRSCMVLCGALAGVAALFKQVAVLHWVFLVVAFALFCEAEGRRRKTLAFAAWSAAGAAVVWGGVVVYFLLEHAWHDFIYHVLLHNLHYITTLSPADRLAHLKDAVAALFKTESIFWLFSVIGNVALWKAHSRKWLSFVLVWAMTSAVGVNASGYFFPHYFQSLPA